MTNTREEIKKAKEQLDWIVRGNGKKYEDPTALRERKFRLQTIIASEGSD